MRLNTTILSYEERRLIHEKSVQILENVGVKCESEKVLAMMEQKGALVDYNSSIVKMDKKLIEDSVSLCPRSFILGARNPEYSIQMPNPETWMTLDGCGVRVIDFETGERRNAVTQDIVNSLKIFEEMDMGRIAWSPLLAQDMPTHSTEVRAYLMSFIHTSKHVQTGLDKPEETGYLRAALREILGDDHTIRDQKICSMIYCPVAPLMHEATMMEAYFELGDLDVPILILPMPAPGSTGPASLYSSIALANAEVLSSIVFYQAAHPGRTIIYGNASGTLNFNTGAFLEGAAETVLQTGATAEMAQYYNMPDIVSGCVTDATETGSQAVFEKMSTTLPLFLNGADFAIGMGLLEGSMCSALEQLVVDNEIAQTCRRLTKGVDVSPETDFYEDIVKIGPGGHFLKQKTTRNARKGNEFYFPRLVERDSYDVWESKGKPNLYSNARDLVRQILSSEPKNPLNYNTEKVINEIMDAADRELK